MFKVISITVLAASILGCSSPQAEETIHYVPHTGTYTEVNDDIGCGSKYSDEKREDIFNEKYRNRKFTWSGTVEIAQSDNLQLNIDYIGTQDLSSLREKPLPLGGGWKRFTQGSFGFECTRE